MSTLPYFREACVEGLDEALIAAKQGADRLELCARLDLDGLTPDQATLRAIKAQVNIPLRVMIRPRAGNFVYSPSEIAAMDAGIDFCHALGVEGVVFGILTSRGTVDLPTTQRLIERARPLKVTFHRAIEQTPDLERALRQLIDHTGVDAILTSGGATHAIDNLSRLERLISLAQDRELIVCGKVTATNLPLLHAQLRARAYHGRRIMEGD